MENTQKFQIIISALILIMATASLFFGPGLVNRFSSNGAQQSSVAPMGNLVTSAVNVTEKNLIVGLWSKNPDLDPDVDKAEADLMENWTFYPDGTFASTHSTVDKDAPPIYDHGTWQYTGNTSYLITMNGLEIHIVRNGNTVTNLDDPCTFRRMTF